MKLVQLYGAIFVFCTVMNKVFAMLFVSRQTWDQAALKLQETKRD